MAQPRSLQPGSSPGLSDVSCCGDDGHIDSRLEISVRGHANFGAVVRTAEPVAHKPHGAGSSVLSSTGSPQDYVISNQICKFHIPWV